MSDVSDRPSRLVLSGVPRVHFYEGGARCPEDIPFPSVMRAIMEFLGEEDLGCLACGKVKPGAAITCSYAFFAGVTGAAAFVSWKPGWAPDNQDLLNICDDPTAPFRRAAEAVGYPVVDLSLRSTDQPRARAAIIESLRVGRPVITFGPIGPPEASIVTGYDEWGDVLIGRSFFQNMEPFSKELEFEPTGEFRTRGWFAAPDGFGYLVLGDRSERPPFKQTYRSALEWLLQLSRTRRTDGNRRTGIDAYTAWAEQLLHEPDFKDKDEVALRERYQVHDCQVGFVAEARWYGAQFLMQASNPGILHHRMSEDLLHAAACYAAEHDLMWKLWGLAGGIGNPDGFRCFSDSSVRRQMVTVIEQSREQYRMGAEYIKKALAR